MACWCTCWWYAWNLVRVHWTLELLRHRSNPVCVGSVLCCVCIDVLSRRTHALASAVLPVAVASVRTDAVRCVAPIESFCAHSRSERVACLPHSRLKTVASRFLSAQLTRLGPRWAEPASKLQAGPRNVKTLEYRSIASDKTSLLWTCRPNIRIRLGWRILMIESSLNSLHVIGRGCVKCVAVCRPVWTLLQFDCIATEQSVISSAEKFQLLLLRW